MLHFEYSFQPYLKSQVLGTVDTLYKNKLQKNIILQVFFPILVHLPFQNITYKPPFKNLWYSTKTVHLSVTLIGTRYGEQLGYICLYQNDRNHRVTVLKNYENSKIYTLSYPKRRKTVLDVHNPMTCTFWYLTNANLPGHFLSNTISPYIFVVNSPTNIIN